MKSFKEFISNKTISAGICLYSDNPWKIFLVHHTLSNFGFSSYGFPKGKVESNNLLKEAIREFEEETGLVLNKDKTLYTYLGFQENKKKIIHIFAYKGTGKEQFIKSNTFAYFNKKTKQTEILPEIDGGDWFELKDVEKMLTRNQKSFVEKFKREIINGN